MFISFDKNRIITAISNKPIEISDEQTVKEIKNNFQVTVGTRMSNTITSLNDFVKKDIKDLRVAVICNWNTNCGISTYSRYLVDEIIKQVSTIKIFSEIEDHPIDELGYDVDRCWERGKCLLPMIKKLKEWNPDFVIVQHEYGIFCNSFYFSQLCQQLDNIPYIVTTHSVYKHLDKLVYTECIKNIVVHTENQKQVLRELGNTSNIFIVPHGCVHYSDTEELWNINHNPYTLIQFGFLFPYKNVERILRAIKLLKDTDSKFNNIFFTYLASENSNNTGTNQVYYDELNKLVVDLSLEENVAIIKKFQTEKMLCLYLRLNKLAVFPYKNNENNTVYSSSGAIKIAMANKIPVIASESHLFDDVQDICPRPSSVEELAREIDHIFSDENYKKQIVQKSYEYIQNNSWNNVAEQYLELYNKLVE